MLKPIENILPVIDGNPGNLIVKTSPQRRPQTTTPVPRDSESVILKGDCVDEAPLLGFWDNKTGSVPVLVVELLCEKICKEMEYSEGLMGFPVETRSFMLWPGVPDDERRGMLKAMSLVHRRWRMPAQTALRGRTFIPAWQLERFLEHPHCGSWVREIQLWDYLRDGGYSLKFLSCFQRTFKQMPNIRALSIRLFNGLQRQIFHRLLDAIPSNYPLRAFHVSVEFWDKNSSLNFCEIVSKLPSLETLSIIRNLGNLPDHPIPDHLVPPPSLKRLLLESHAVSQLPRETLSWLLRPRGAYALEELRIRQRIGMDEHPRIGLAEQLGEKDPIAPLLSSFRGTLPNLKSLEVSLWSYHGLHGSFKSLEAFCNVQKLVDRCTNLEELHGNMLSMPGIRLPPTIQSLHVSRCYPYTWPVDLQDDTHISWILSTKISAKELPNLNALYISTWVPPLHDFAYMFIREELVQTAEVCEKFGISYSMVEDSTILPKCTWNGRKR